MGGPRKYRPVIAESRANSEWRMANSGGRIGYSIRYSLFAIRAFPDESHDPVDDAKGAAVAEPDPRACRPTLSAVTDRQPAAGQVAQAPHVRGVLRACAAARGRIACARAREGRPGRDLVME